MNSLDADDWAIGTAYGILAPKIQKVRFLETKPNLYPLNNKDQLSVTNPRDMLHHGERAANK